MIIHRSVKNLQRPLNRMFALSAYRSSQPKTLANQDKLPRLPIPELEQTLQGYLKSLPPVLEQKYGQDKVVKELEKRKLYVKDFAQPGGLGQTLTERLKDLDTASPNNWLNDTLWLTLAYHTWRAPLLINSNWWLLFKDDPNAPTPTENETAPRQDVAIKEGSPDTSKRTIQRAEVKKENVTEWQVRRAAWLVSRFLDFKGKLDREEIAPDASRSGPFCMHQYTRMFGLTRIPRWDCDIFNVPDASAKHMTVLINDHVYSVDVLDDQGQALPPNEIENKLWQVVDDVSRAGPALRVGALSADERDSWTKNRERLLALKNRPTLDNIESSLFALSLDTHTLESQPTSDPLIRPSLDAHVQNCASGHAGRNRWFDKALSLVIETDGRAGMMGEHSPCDALIPSVIVDYVVAEPVDISRFDAQPSRTDGWKRLEWNVDEELQTEIQQCEERNWKIVEDSDASQLWWSEYGADWIKKIAKQSPDAYIQMALQLAWYKNQGYFTATYETASTRSFKHGRTDVIRTLSEDSVAFVKAMLSESSSDAERYEALSKATASHNALTRQSSMGQGIDRHLMGLRTQLRPGETHPLFEDEAYSKSQEWKLSTSGLSAGLRFKGTGFGTVWPDGYGLNYLAGPNLVKFGIESKYSCDSTSTAQFKHHIAESLRDMRRVCEATANKAKL